MWQHLFLVLRSSTEIQSDHLIVYSNFTGEWSPEKDCCGWWWLTFQQPEWKSSSESSERLLCNCLPHSLSIHLTLMMTSAQVVETSVTTTDNSHSQGYTHPDNQTTLSHVTPRFKSLWPNEWIMQIKCMLRGW